ncbi:NAD(P)/FAD-dependent oxidoreductase [Radicibacter daui]|uniref:NAD(P)/FAD-dependent oxidoreductase n=1 Tax=Radicibacter daui TaxID=3064829 RepID=UPI004046EB32
MAKQGAKQGRVLVVGAGINGLSTAWGLARRGFEVAVFDQGAIPNPVSSSFDEHRATRHAYGEMHRYARMMPAAFATYEQMWVDIGRSHYDPVGLVVFQREDDSWINASLADMDEMGIGWREIEVTAVPELYPMIAPEGLTRAVAMEGAGVLFPSRIVTDLVVHLSLKGVAFHANTKIAAIDPETASLTTADGKQHQGDYIVIAAGAWATRLVPELATEATPSRQAVIFVAPPVELATQWQVAPVFFDLGKDSGTYTLPPRPGTRLKIGDHEFTRRGDPDGSRIADDGDVERLMKAASLSYAGFERYSVLERKACFYTVTDDERFIARPIGPKASLLSACSGHGFKLGALMGDLMAKGIAQGEPFVH